MAALCNPVVDWNWFVADIAHYLAFIYGVIAACAYLKAFWAAGQIRKYQTSPDSSGMKSPCLLENYFFPFNEMHLNNFFLLLPHNMTAGHIFIWLFVNFLFSSSPVCVCVYSSRICITMNKLTALEINIPDTQKRCATAFGNMNGT